MAAAVLLGVIAPACGSGSTETNTTTTTETGTGGTTGTTTSTTTTSSGTGGTTGSTTSSTTTSSGTGGTGTGGSDPGSHGPPASQLVNGGDVVKSNSYKMVFTLGQPTQNQTKTTSPGYRMQGGLIGATGNLP